MGKVLGEVYLLPGNPTMIRCTTAEATPPGSWKAPETESLQCLSPEEPWKALDKENFPSRRGGHCFMSPGTCREHRDPSSSPYPIYPPYISE